MNLKVFNNDNLKEEEIKDKIIRVKALIVNSKHEILLGEAYNTIQFPGGHLKPNEDLSMGLKREIAEETGLILTNNYEPFFHLQRFIKDNLNNNNRLIEIYYYPIFTDEHYNPQNLNLDNQEQAGNFHLFYVPINEVPKILNATIDKNPLNTIIYEEMLLALAEWSQIYGK